MVNDDTRVTNIKMALEKLIKSHRYLFPINPALEQAYMEDPELKDDFMGLVQKEIRPIFITWKSSCNKKK